MKFTKYLISGAVLLSALVSFTSCVKEDFDTPPINIPKVDFKSNISIADLKTLYLNSGQTLYEIKSDTIIQGIVIGNDESGNYYKTMIIRDNTAGIELKLDQTNLYTEYKIGQRVFIKCKGLYIGNYGNLIQLGYIYQGAIGRIPQIFIKNHLFKDSLPGAAPIPVLTTIPSLPSTPLSTLIKLENVHFELAGDEFAPQTADATSRNLLDDANNIVVIRTSKYANFAGTKMPEGKGTIVGVLSIFNGIYQITIRDMKDVISFDPGALPKNLLQEKFDVLPANWTIFSAASNKNWVHESTDKAMSANGYGGDVGSDDWLISPGVTLSNYTNYALNFTTWTRYTDTGILNPLNIYISTDYSGSGDPTTSTWDPITCTLPAAHSQVWTPSGAVNLNSFSGQKVYIAFRYRSSGVSSNSASHWKVDNFALTGMN